MSSGPGREDDALTASERRRLSALRAAESLSDLVELTGATSEHRAYFEAKSEWFDLRGRELPEGESGEGIPGTGVVVDGVEFQVHGITHADTEAERSFLRREVEALREAGASVYCEQGIRGMYFQDDPDVCEMDDYRWALEQCRLLDIEGRLSKYGPEFEGLIENVDDLASEFREAVFSLVDSGSSLYGEEFEGALGDVATAFLTSHAGVATGEDFEAYRLRREAAEDPRKLADLQRYYARRFLPQPVEREWLARHDRELEVFTHARNERMADYAVYHHETAPEVHLLVGAAHQPGVVYYLERHREGQRTTGGFELV